MHIEAEWLATGDNGKADALSRLEMDRFLTLGGNKMEQEPTSIPEDIWPIHKIWSYN